MPSTFRTATSHRGSGSRIAVAIVSAVVVCVVMIVPVPRPVAADQVADLEARATAISQTLVQEQLEIDTDRQQYSLASENVAADTAAITQMARQVLEDEQQISRQTSVLHDQAIGAYMDAGGEISSPDVALFTGKEESVEAAGEYAEIVVGDIDTTLGKVHGAQRDLQADEGALEQRQLQDQSDQQQASTDLSEADATEEQLDSLQTQVTGQLALAVEVDSADRAAASRSDSDPVLNPFLECVVQAESGGDYEAVSPNGMYMGAFQFSQATWNMAATAAGRPDLVGVAPDVASKADQDAMAVALYDLDGEHPWFDPCRS